MSTRLPHGFDPDSAGSVEHYRDAPLYDYEYRRRRADVNFYRELAREHGDPILELGCGTGRVLVALCRDGHTVVGLDRSAPMLLQAQRRIQRLGASRRRGVLIRADFRRYALKRKFPLIICPFNAFQHLYTREDIEAFLACVRDHLAPDGRFAFDVLFPDLKWLLRDPLKHWARTRFRHPTTKRPFLYTTNHTYDPVSQIAFIRIFYEPLDEPENRRRTRTVRLAHRQFFPSELEALLHYNGLDVEARYGGFRGEPLGPDSDSIVMICVRARR